MSRVLQWYGPALADPPPVALLRASRSNHGLRLSRFHLRAPDRHVAIRNEAGAVVGYYTPQQTPSGVRFGPIYVLREHRGHGHAARIYRQWAAEHVCVVYAEDGLTASHRAALAGGLRVWKRGRWGTYYRGGPCT